MQVPTVLRCTAIYALLFISFATRAQLSEADKNTAVQTIAKSIADNYVDADKGGQISNYILTANYKGAFKKATSWQQFDEMVTASLQEFSNDKHLYVRNNAAEVKKLRAEPAQEEKMNTSETNSTDNYGFKETKLLENNTGYIKLSSINITKNSLNTLYENMRKVENTDALIIDLRDNKGGASDVGAVLETYFLPAGKPLLEFKTRQGATTTESTVDWLKEKKYDKPVYIIINKNTGSAAEAFAFVMQKNKRATIVGETSSGAANRNEWFVINDENYLSVSTATATLPGTATSWEVSGVKPDIKVKNGDPIAAIIKK